MEKKEHLTEKEKLHNGKIAVLLTCFNRREKTVACISSLGNGQEGQRLHFIVTDDNSSDGTKEALQQLPFEITVLDGNGKLFWNGGMRKAFAYALKHCKKYEYVMLVNDDVVFYEDALPNLLSRFQHTKTDVVVGSTCDDKKEMSYGGVRKRSKLFARYELIPPGKEPKECDTFNGNCVLLKTDVFVKNGNLDPAYIHSMSDYDYGMALRRNGYRIVNAKYHVGECNDNDKKGTWLDTSLPRKKRLELKEGPKGLPRQDWFHFVKKNYGVLPALYHSATPYLRILLGK